MPQEAPDRMPSLRLRTGPYCVEAARVPAAVGVPRLRPVVRPRRAGRNANVRSRPPLAIKGYSYRMSNLPSLPDLKRRTKQALSVARQAVLTEARHVVETHGPAGLIVTHLAKKHDVAPLTVRRWLAGHGFDLSHLTRGRPSFHKVASLGATEGEGQ